MNEQQFQSQVKQSGKPVIVDFWAPWCLPCRATKPLLEKLAQEYAGDVHFLPVNADDSRPLLERYQVLSIPTLLALRDGQVVGRLTGAQGEAGYRALFEALVSGQEVKRGLQPFERLLRLGAGALLIAAGFSLNNWLAAGLGAGIAFLGVYDRCPVWAALTSLWRRMAKGQPSA